MFTGIIEDKGTVTSIVKGSKSAVIEIRSDVIMDDIKLGDSVAVNGVCLTCTDISKQTFKADIMAETLRRTSLGVLKSGSKVNLERAMKADGRFGGHIVSGHIDGTGTISDISPEANAVWYSIKASKDILNHIVMKGSIAIDGISLTVAYIDDQIFKVSIIPHTLKETILSEKKVGDIVNLENDIIGKYVEKLLRVSESPDNNKKKNDSSFEETLALNGFL